MVEDNTAHDARQAADMDVDVNREHVGAVYAEAFLAVSENARATESLLGVFDSLVEDVLDAFPHFEQVLGSALIPQEERYGILDRVFGPRAPAVFLDFLKVVARHERLDCLRAIHQQVHVQYDRLRRRVPVTLTTAVAVDAARAQRITQQLAGLIDGEPLMEYRVDPDLIGGAVVRVGDTVYDGSLAAALQNARQKMIDRSVHEIQSRRDRFRNPAGN
ncbi:MAG: ATP synthase F1 subunit delta [Pirellulales bacterium]|nr:ATP synthase F1 subunit delta [Pirellulales bacterium]